MVSMRMIYMYMRITLQVWELNIRDGLNPKVLEPMKIDEIISLNYHSIICIRNDNI